MNTQRFETIVARARIGLWTGIALVTLFFCRGQWPQAWQVATFGAGITLFWPLVVTRGRDLSPEELRTCQRWQIGIDLLVATGLVGVSGGWSSPFAPLVLATTLEARALLGHRESVFVAILAVALNLIHFRTGVSLQSALLYSLASGTLLVAALLTEATHQLTLPGRQLWQRRSLLKTQEGTIERLQLQLEQTERDQQELREKYREVTALHREQRAQMIRLRIGEQLFATSVSQLQDDATGNMALSRLLRLVMDTVEAGGAILWLRASDNNLLVPHLIEGTAGISVLGEKIGPVDTLTPYELRIRCEARLQAACTDSTTTGMPSPDFRSESFSESFSESRLEAEAILHGSAVAYHHSSDNQSMTARGKEARSTRPSDRGADGRWPIAAGAGTTSIATDYEPGHSDSLSNNLESIDLDGEDNADNADNEQTEETMLAVAMRAAESIQGEVPHQDAISTATKLQPAVMVVLLRAEGNDGQIMGAIGVCDPRTGMKLDFPTQEQERLQALSRSLSAAVSNVLQRVESAQRLRTVSQLYDLSRMAQCATEREQVYQGIVTRVVDAIGCEHCTLFLCDQNHTEPAGKSTEPGGYQSAEQSPWNPSASKSRNYGEGRYLEAVATRGRLVNLLEHFQFEGGQGVSGWVAGKGRLLHIPDLLRETNLLIPQTLPAQIRSFVAVPLRAQEQIVGVLHLSHSRAYAFSPDDLRLLNLLATESAHALERLSLFQSA